MVSHMTLDEYVLSLEGKTISVVGLGVSNMPLIELLARAGHSVIGRDRASIEAMGARGETLKALGVSLRLGDAYMEDLAEDVIFRTPGMHPDTPELRAARERGSLVTSEMELFFSLCPCRVFAVTGSDGKTTTTTVISLLLEAAGIRVHLGGNIGRPLLTEIPNISPEDIAVLELSSFQLHSMYCRPDVAVITNITPNHLDVHPDMDDYVNAKCSIFRNQDGDCRLVLNLSDGRTDSLASEASATVSYFSRYEEPGRGAFLRDGGVYLARGNGEEVFVMNASEIKLPGVHNVENYLAAFAAVDGVVPPECMAAVARSFGGVPHRLELVREFKGVRYYNDSIASSPTRTIAGLRSFTERPVLIAGGYDKHIPFDELGVEIVSRVKALYLTGATAEMIHAAVVNAPGYDSETLTIAIVEDFRDAVLLAAQSAEPGDVVLLSPACASFDKFSNFEERGNYFKEIVREAFS